MTWRRVGLEGAEFVDPCRCYKDDVSSGPSPTDPGLGGFMAGGSSGSVLGMPVTDASSGFAPTGSTAPTAGSTFAGAPSVPQLFSLGSTFGGSDPGAGVPNTGGVASPTTASLGTPGGITTSAAPAATGPVSPLGAPGIGSPTDLSSAFYDPNNPASSPFGGAPQGGATTTTLSASQLGAPQVAPSSPANATAGGNVGNNPSPESKSIFDSLGIKSPLGAAIGAGGLAYSALENKAPKFSPQLEAQAASLNANGQQLMSYLQSGSLPPGLQASLTQATSAAKAKIISNFAAQGLNVDPTNGYANNSALQAELAAVDQQALISTAQIGQQLMQTGITESGLSSDLYKTLANIDQTQTANIGKAIANFASALSGGGGGLNLSLAKS